MDKNNRTGARRAALLSLVRCEAAGRYSNLEIDASIRKFGLDGSERGLYTTLVYGVIERRITLDYIIAKLSSKPLEALDLEVITLLRIGLYQLIWLDRIPESAAVNESVELAKQIKPRSAPFVNALLREFIRSIGRDKLPYPDRSDRIKYLSVRYSCSEDVVRVLESSVGDSEALLASFEVQPETTLRVNTLKISREALLEKLRENQVEACPTRYSSFGVKLSSHTFPETLKELIDAGYVYIQDEASQLAVIAVDPKPGQTVFDVCACPGGKSFSAAILMENKGRVMSFDLHENKLSLIENGAEKLGITIISSAQKDASVFDEALEKMADIVLCDAPCSGLGVIAKKPDLRYKRLEDIVRLPEVQYKILSNSSNYVKPGGKLFYTTCTLNRAENESVAMRFLEENPVFEPMDFDTGGIKSEDGMLTIYPHIHNTDGFFISGFKRN